MTCAVRVIQSVDLAEAEFTCSVTILCPVSDLLPIGPLSDRLSIGSARIVGAPMLSTYLHFDPAAEGPDAGERTRHGWEHLL